MKIIQIGNFLSYDNVAKVDYMSDEYFLDADIIIIDLESLYEQIMLFFHRKRKLNGAIKNTAYAQFKEFTSKRTAELKRFYELGGNLFCIPVYNPIETIEVETILDETSLEKVDLFNLIGLDFLDFEISKRSGSNVIITDSNYQLLFNCFDCSYNFIYTKHKGRVLAKIKATEEPIALAFNLERGNVIMLPILKINSVDFEEYDNKVSQVLVQIASLNELLQENRNKLVPPEIPDWCTGYLIGDEQTELVKFEKLQHHRISVLEALDQQLLVIEEYSLLKRLLFATGKPLEEVALKVFIDLGYELLKSAPDRADMIIRHKNDTAVIEIKGQRKSASEDNAAQLSKWKVLFYGDHKINPKGILIINPFKDRPLVERIETVFPSQMLHYVNQMQLNLLTTQQLLEMYIDFKQEKLTFDEVHDMLFKNIGILNYRSDAIVRWISPLVQERQED